MNMQIGTRSIAVVVVGFSGMTGAFADHAPEGKSAAPAATTAAPAPMPAVSVTAAKPVVAGAASPSTAAAPTTPAAAPGHSLHGEVFDEGPRQKAYLMKGMPKINFPVTTKSAEVQAFF